MFTNEMILYRGSEFQKLLDDFVWLMENFNHQEKGGTLRVYLDGYSANGGGNVKDLLFRNINRLIEIADTYGLEGNLWHGFLALFIAYNENAFSKSCEVSGNVQGTVVEIAKHDFIIFQELFHYDFKEMETVLGTDIFTVLKDYEGDSSKGKMLDKQIGDYINEFAVELFAAKDTQKFLETVTSFYKKFGVGKLGLHKAFRVVHKDRQVVIEPITNIEHAHLKDLIGYERQKAKLTANTDAFMEGLAANNVLLFGDSGTGKSSSIKAILNEYYGRGLRMIEVYKHQFQDLSDIISQIKDRNYKFIIYMDDLSFEDFELEYKYLKAIIEGGLGQRPDNVLIYATSNRRHLIREKFSDKREISDDLHNNDTVQEKLSLAARFGVTIYYGSPDKKEFQNIVKLLAEKYHITMDEEALYEEANKWELTHGGLSGRTAIQFITHLLGQ